MSKLREPTPVVGIKIELTECDVHGAHVTDVDVVRLGEVAYEAPDADQTIAGAITSSTVGWSRSYDEGWARTFGKRSAEDASN